MFGKERGAHAFQHFKYNLQVLCILHEGEGRGQAAVCLWGCRCMMISRMKFKINEEENEVCSFICGGSHAMQDEQMLSKTANLRGDFGSHSGLPPERKRLREMGAQILNSIQCTRSSAIR